MIFRIGEFFCGPGGIGYAAKETKLNVDGKLWAFKHIWANDIDHDACETYLANVLEDDREAIIESPIESLDLHSLASIDGLTFGFPCNDFSVVGEQNGMGGYFGPLYSYGVELLRIQSPMWFLAENVGGLQSANDGEAFLRILSDLEQAGEGYTLTPHLYHFEEYGVPQTRHRIIIVGIKKNLELKFRIPAPTTLAPCTQISAREAIENPPIPDDAPNHERTVHSKTVVERLKYIPAGQNAWYEGIPEHLQLNVKGARLSQIYRRLYPDRPAYTITGSGGGGTHVYHWFENRALTNRERARLQTFPDTFVFSGHKESVRKQIGMAVPVRGAMVILEAILKTFAGIEYESVPAKWEDYSENLEE